MKPILRRLEIDNRTSWQGVRKLVDNLKPGETANTLILTHEHGKIRNFRATLIHLYGPGKFTTATFDENDNKLDHLWVMRIM